MEFISGWTDPSLCSEAHFHECAFKEVLRIYNIWIFGTPTCYVSQVRSTYLVMSPNFGIINMSEQSKFPLKQLKKRKKPKPI